MRNVFSLKSTVLVVASWGILSAHPLNTWASCPDEIRARLSNALLNTKASSIERNELIRKSPLSDDELEAYADRRYRGRVGTRLLQRLRALGKQYKPLLRDPGLILRLKEFENFVHAHPELGTLDAWQMRESFSKSLGYKTVYRAMALTEQEYKNIQANGIESGLARTISDRPPSEKDRYFKSYLREDLKEQTHRRIMQQTGANDPLISVTEIPDVALAVAKNYKSENKKIFLFKINVPALDMLSRDHDEVGIFHTTFGYWNIPGHQSPVSWSDPRVESFIYYKISPSEVISEQQFDPKDIANLSESN